MKIKFTVQRIENFEIELDEDAYDIPEDRIEFADWYYYMKKEAEEDPKGLVQEWKAKSILTEYVDPILKIER